MTAGSGMMLSRQAQRLYWMSRYVERAENMARLVSVHDKLLLDQQQDHGVRAASEWQPLVEITGNTEFFIQAFGKDASYKENRTLRFLLIEAANPGSMLSSIEMARENGRTLRALLPREAWETLNEMTLETRASHEQALKSGERADYLTKTVRRCQTLVGLLDGTMNHDSGYRFVELGRLLERADMTTRIIDVYSRTVLGSEQNTDGDENNHWVPVLKSLAAYQMYRQRRQVRVRRIDALDFLIRDQAFPRACLYCLRTAEEAIRRLPNPSGPRTEVRRAAKMLSDARVERFANNPKRMSAFVDRVQVALGKVHASIEATWFDA